MIAQLAQYEVEISTGFSAAWAVIIVLIGLAAYIYSAICLMKIANKTNQDYPWFAWIPILNLYLMTQIAGRDVVWFILLLIPCVNIVVMILVFMDIAAVLGFENWWGALIIIPIFNFYVLYKLAFTEPY